MQIRAAVIGAGSWGTTIAHLLAHNVPTVLWGRHADVVDEVARHHRNSRYLPGASLHPALTATADLAEAVGSAEVVVMAVPSHGFRATLEGLAGHLGRWVPVVSLAKGLEQGSGLRMTEVVAQVLPGHPTGVLTGPNLAREILDGHDAASVLAMADVAIAEQLQDAFATSWFRVYTNEDVVGCEVAGAFKNVVAIAAGMGVGLGTGDNTRAAVITRGLAEMSRLGTALGGQPLTFAGLAGIGDLLATCTSPQSRNRHVGEELGRGRTLAEVVAETPMVAEGVRTTSVMVALGRKHGLELPIAEQVEAVVQGRLAAAAAYRRLLDRPHRRELHGLVPPSDA